MNIGLLIVGDEIMSGKRRDAHMPKVIDLLAARGLMLSWARYVGDDRPLITAALADAFAGGDLVFSCGGIGATPAGHTRRGARGARGGVAGALAEALAGGDLVFSCGGIGATPDDHTRQCAAAALGVELELHPQAEALIRERMQDIAREQGVPYEADRADNVHRLNMGVFPKGASVIPNPYNK